MRRLQLPFWSTQRFTSWIVDLFCGYGEAPMRVVLFSLLLIFICSIFYFFFGLSFNGNHLIYRPGAPFEQNAIFLLECLYYSVVTFTTLGYGDFTPSASQGSSPPSRPSPAASRWRCLWWCLSRR